MKKILVCLCAMGMLFLLQPCVFAEEADLFETQAASFGVEALASSLPEESREILKTWGVSAADSENLLSLRTETVFESLGRLAKENAVPAVRNAAWSIGLLMICALLHSMNGNEGGETVRVFRLVAVLLLAGVLLSPIQTLLNDTQTLIGSACGFLGVFVLVYAGIAAAAGQTLTAGAYATLTVAAAEGAQILIRIGLLPLLRILLAVTTVLSATKQSVLAQVAQGVRTCFRWILGLSMSIFLALLALQSTVRAAADSVSSRAVKFAIGGSVPLVGGALNEALNTARSCLTLLKSTVGVFGILAGCAVFIPMLIRVALWMLSLNFSAWVGDILEEREAADFLRAIAALVAMIGALMLCCMLFLIISTGILLAAKTA